MPARYSLLIRHGTLIDGTRAPRYAADLAIRDGRIAAIGRLDKARADAEIDASGKIVAPGFIDAHTHDDRLMLSAPEMAPKASQGVTTVVAGNCGVSLAPSPHGMARPCRRRSTCSTPKAGVSAFRASPPTWRSPARHRRPPTAPFS